MNLDKIETQEEKEAFEGMANSSEVPNSSDWDDEDELPPIGCKVMTSFTESDCDSWCDFHGPSEIIAYHGDYVWVAHHGKFNRIHALSDIEFEKPETPEQKAERERLEFIDSMFVELNPRDVKELYEGHRNSSAWKLCAKAYDAGYRKQNG